jgi:acyl-coenzyme A thioesterase PaaI-like protein
VAPGPPESSGAPAPDPTAPDERRLAAAAALRDLNHAFVAHDRDLDGLAAIERLASEQAAAMRTGTRRDRLARMRAAREAAGADETTFAAARPGSGFEDRAVAGRANPTSVDLDVQFVDDEVVADVVLRRAFEGAPGRAHGGIVAAVFDDVTGFVIGRLGEPAFTGELTVRFLAPVPVDAPIVVRARLDGRERRKLFISADASAGDTVIATCRAIYITVDPSIFSGAPDPR